MYRRSWVRILLILMLLGISLAACQQPEPTATPVPTSTEAPPTATPVPEAEETEAEEEAVEGPAITVNGQAYTMEQLKAMEQLTIEVEQPDQEELEEYTGVSILALLEDAGAEGGMVRFVADDGYEVEVPIDELTDQSILAYRTEGGLRSVIPGSDSSLWVKGVITLETLTAEEETSTEEAAPVETEAESEEVAGGPIQVTDALGNEITFDSPPTRIVVPGKASWMVGHPLYLFPEAEERVLAMEARRGNVSPFLAAIYADFVDKPHLEMDTGPEQIAPLEPDAIVIKSYMAEQLGEPLQQLGFPVVHVELETPDQFYSDVETLGQMFANEKRADEIISFYEKRVSLVQERTADLGDEEKPRTLVIQWEGGEEGNAFSVPPVSWMQTIQAQMAGGQPVWEEAAGSGWQVVGFDQIAAWDPDKVFLIVFRDDPAPIVAQINDDPAWQELTAMQENEFYVFPADYYGWDVPDPRWIMGMTWMAQKLHPGLFADIDIAEEVYEFYGQMYRMDRDAVDELIMPQLTGDVGISTD